MKETDVVATTHSAQLTNMLFMPTGSSVMEMLPPRLPRRRRRRPVHLPMVPELVPVQYDSAWRDDGGEVGRGDKARSGRTPQTSLGATSSSSAKCFAAYQDRQVGVNECFVAEWTRRVLKQRLESGMRRSARSKVPLACPCRI